MSNDELIKWIKDDLEKLEEKVDVNFSRIDGKLDNLMQLKWTVAGMALFGSALLTGMFQIALVYMKGRI